MLKEPFSPSTAGGAMPAQTLDEHLRGRNGRAATAAYDARQMPDAEVDRRRKLAEVANQGGYGVGLGEQNQCQSTEAPRFGLVDRIARVAFELDSDTSTVNRRRRALHELQAFLQPYNPEVIDRIITLIHEAGL